jgi:hypothetical protein
LAFEAFGLCKLRMRFPLFFFDYFLLVFLVFKLIFVFLKGFLVFCWEFFKGILVILRSGEIYIRVFREELVHL